MPKISLTVFWCLICFLEKVTSLKPGKPHIIFILADDLGFNDVPWHNEKVVAPNLKQLAEEGIILEQSYVSPLCTPTRASILSGIYPFATGRQGNVIWPLSPTGLTTDVPLLPQFLKPLGYQTHAVGKWHLGFCNWKYTPTERGFDTFRGFYHGGEDYFDHNLEWGCNPPHHRNGANGNQTQPFGLDFRDNREPYFNATGVYSTYEFASRVETLLHSGNSSSPKFIYLAFQSVHAPLQVPDNYTKPYDYVKDQSRRTYLGMVSAMDEAIGRVVKALKDTGHYDNSVIVFTTDNGGPTAYGANNWPLQGNKMTLWEGGTRGAAFIHSPLLANKKGTVSQNLIFATDWMSTLLSLAGGQPPPKIDSMNQWEALQKGIPSPRKEMVYEILYIPKMGLRAAIRVGDYKLIMGNPGRLSLGNLRPDPCAEKVNRNASCQEEVDFLMQCPTLIYKIFNEDPSFNKIPEVGTAEQILKTGPIKLYNLKEDPEERVNLATKNESLVIELINRVLSYMHRYVPIDAPDYDPKGDPKYWNGVWSPGWC